MKERAIVRYINENWKVLRVIVSELDALHYHVRIDITKDLCLAVDLHKELSAAVWQTEIDKAIKHHAYKYFQREETLAHVYPVCDNCGYVLKGLKYDKGRPPVTLDGITSNLLVKENVINPSHCPNCKKKIAAIVDKRSIPSGTEFSYPDDYPEE